MGAITLAMLDRAAVSLATAGGSLGNYVWIFL